MKTHSLLYKKPYNIVLYLILSIFLLSSCSEQSTPERTIQQFETALNVSDYEGILNCYEPKVKNGIMGMATIAGNLFGVDGSAVLNILPFALDVLAESDDHLAENIEEIERVLESIDIVVNDVQYNDQQTKASVSVTVTICDSSQNGTIDMVKVQNVWYING